MALPIINLSLIPTFPARVFGSGPVTIVKTGLDITIDWDISTFSTNPAPDTAQALLLGYSPSTGAGELYPLAGIQSGFQITASQIIDSTATGRAVLTGDATAGRTALGLGPIATLNVGSGLSSSAGALLLANTAVTPGTYTLATITVGADGRVTAASSGALAAGIFGQCRLVKVSTNLVLQPFAGNLITINGANQAIPNAGVSLAATGLTPGTLYNIYVYMNGSTMTLEASATAHATSTSNGSEIKSGDATRALVGVWLCATGPAWTADDGTQVGGLSWFNRRRKTAIKKFTTNRSVNSGGAMAEVNAEIQTRFVNWAGDEVIAEVAGGWACTGAATGYAEIRIDGSAPTVTRQSIVSTTFATPMALRLDPTPTEGSHYATIFAKAVSGTNVLFVGGADGEVSLAVHVMG